MNYRSITAFTAALATAAGAQVASAVTAYEVIQIGNLPGAEGGRALAINSRNIVLGNSNSGSTNQAWFYSESGGMTPLAVGLPHDFHGTDLNNLNQASSYSEAWQSGARITPNSIAVWGGLPGYNELEGLGINDSGAMVGGAWKQGVSQAIRFKVDFTKTLLPNLNQSGVSRAYRVNNAGVAVGNSDGKAVLWTANNAIVNLHTMLPVGTIGSSALDINDAGWVTGYFYDSGNNFRGFRFAFETGMMMFDPLAGHAMLNARGINIHGHIVGQSRRSVSAGTYEATLFDGFTMRSLNSLIPAHSGWFLNEANDINDNGYIVGRGHFNGVETNYMLKPVPEPASLLALGGGLLAFLRTRKSRK